MKSQLWSCLALAACALASTVASAQNFPTKPLRIVVPSAPGAILDLVGRIIAPPMAEEQWHSGPAISEACS